jgi:hypothetical protein
MNAGQSSERIWKNIRVQAHNAELERVHTPIWRRITRQAGTSVFDWVQRQPWNYEPWNTTFSIVVGTQAKEDNDG